MRIEYLGANLVTAMKELTTSQNLAKLLTYQDTPYSNPNLSADELQGLILSKLFPYPFTLNTVPDDVCHIYVWNPYGTFKNGEVIEHNDFYWDIVCAKSLWLCNVGYASIRPYEVMKEIIKIYNDRSISTLGRVHFTDWEHLIIDNQFSGIRLIGNNFTIGQ